MSNLIFLYYFSLLVVLKLSQSSLHIKAGNNITQDKSSEFVVSIQLNSHFHYETFLSFLTIAITNNIQDLIPMSIHAYPYPPATKLIIPIKHFYRKPSRIYMITNSTTFNNVTLEFLDETYNPHIPYLTNVNICIIITAFTDCHESMTGLNRNYEFCHVRWEDYIKYHNVLLVSHFFDPRKVNSYRDYSHMLIFLNPTVSQYNITYKKTSYKYIVPSIMPKLPMLDNNTTILLDSFLSRIPIGINLVVQGVIIETHRDINALLKLNTFIWENNYLRNKYR